jgi:hypothetical protein
MTCSTFYCLYDTLMDPWNVCIYYIAMYVCAGPSGRAVYGCSPAEIMGPNSTGGMDVSLYCESSRGVLPTVMCRV